MVIAVAEIDVELIVKDTFSSYRGIDGVLRSRVRRSSDASESVLVLKFVLVLESGGVLIPGEAKLCKEDG